MTTRDPYPIGALLRAAVTAYRERTGALEQDVAHAAGVTPQVLSRALREGSEPRPPTVRAVLRAIGAHAVIVNDS